jgi:SAM-dependent methyltransferase
MAGRYKDRDPAREREHFEKVVATRGRIYWADRTPAGKRRQEVRAGLLVERSATAAGQRVLEIGCGTGDYSRVLERLLQARLVSVDVAPKVAAIARHTTGAGTDVMAADVECLPFPDATFDAIIGNAVLHHLRLDRALPELHRVLRPGGGFCFAEPNILNPHIFIERTVPFVGRWLDDSPGEVAFTRWGLEQKARAAGFTDVRVRPFDFLYPMIPARFVPLAERLGHVLERTALVREIAGSLLLTARRVAA